MARKTIILGIIFINAFFISNSLAITITVDDDGPADFNNIQDAIDDANDGDEVIIMPGTYTGDGNRDIDFNGLAITVRSTDPNDPCIVESTIIDCNGSETEAHRGFIFQSGEDSNSIVAGLTIINGHTTGTYYWLPTLGGGGICCNSSSPKISNCVFSNNITEGFSHGGGGIYCYDSNAVISGCRLIDNTSYAYWKQGCCFYNGYGGGIACIYGNPTINDCIISRNLSEPARGGGICCVDSNAIITNSKIINNSSQNIKCEDANVAITNCEISNYESIQTGYHAGGISSEGSYLEVRDCLIAGNCYWKGAGIYLDSSSTSIVENCIIQDNRAYHGGGGIFNSSSSLTVIDCQLIDNDASEDGGGLYNTSSSAIVTNCIFSDNRLFSSVSDGAGMYNKNSSVTITNCVFISNPSLSVYYGGGIFNASSSLIVTSCIFWDNIPYQIVGSATVTYSDVKGGYSGEGNIACDPCFVYTSGSDHKLWNLRLKPDSPCIDTGDPNYFDPNYPTDLDGRDRYVDGDCNDTEIIDMGAYEFSWTYIGDFQGDDCDVDFMDFAVFALTWLAEDGDVQYNPVCDISIPADAHIDEMDLRIFTNNWLAGTEP